MIVCVCVCFLFVHNFVEREKRGERICGRMQFIVIIINVIWFDLDHSVYLMFQTLFINCVFIFQNKIKCNWLNISLFSLFSESVVFGLSKLIAQREREREIAARR